jgi:glutaryl-CoA dehydrogenase
MKPTQGTAVDPGQTVPKGDFPSGNGKSSGVEHWQGR